MTSHTRKLVEHIFFFIILATSIFLLWEVFAPFAGTLALSAIIVTICYPIHKRVLKLVNKKRKSLAAFISVFVVLVVVILPFALIASLISAEAFEIYKSLSNSDHSTFANSVDHLQSLLQAVIPGFSLDIATILQQAAAWVADSFLSILAGTASVVFFFFIALIGTYFFFKDGKQFTQYLIELSPLADDDDEKILDRLGNAVRSVALGTLAIAVLQGILTAAGLAFFGFERYILWGSIAALGALIPGVGTTIVLAPAIVVLFYKGYLLSSLLLLLWGVLIVGLVDNIIGPKIMSRGNKMHPFLILISVLGGLAYFGPIGFVLGPVILSFFLVLLELYNSHVREEL